MWCIVKVQGALKSMCSSDIQSWTKHCLLLTRCCLLITLSHLGGLPRPLLGNIFLKIFPRLSSIIIFHFLFLVINNSNQLNKLDQNLIFFSIFVWKKSLPFKSQLEILYFMSWHGLIVDTGITWFNISLCCTLHSTDNFDYIIVYFLLHHILDSFIQVIIDDKTT